MTPESALPGWVHSSKLVVKPDCLIKRRGKAGLLLLNAEWPEAQKWIEARAGKPVNVRDVGRLHRCVGNSTRCRRFVCIWVDC